MSVASRAMALLNEQYRIILRRMAKLNWWSEVGGIFNLAKRARLAGGAAVAPMETLEPSGSSQSN